MSSTHEILKASGQEHILKFYDELSEQEKDHLESDIEQIDWENFTTIYREQVVPRLDGVKPKPVAKIDSNLLRELPDECIEGTTRCSAEQLSHYKQVGLTNIKQGKVAALLLAGGQGTRLGVGYPKGMYDVGLPSHKSLFQLQAERIRELICGDDDKATSLQDSKQSIIWYIMTSEATMTETKNFFAINNYFGLCPDRVVFFEQGTYPCFGFDGKVFLDKKSKISRSPGGNGGLYEALREKLILEHMSKNSIEFVHVYCVDNILVRVCDPTFMGYCIERNVDTGAKVVEKVQPTESVGVICKVGQQFKVIEYSEIPEDIACKRNVSTGKLAFSAGNICEHFFRLNFLKSMSDQSRLRYHLAIKKIPHVCLTTGEQVKPSEPNGIKLEKFIFDVFEYAEKFAAWEVKREDEFSPLKNADGTEKDNPTTAREALLRAYKLGLFAQ